MSDTALRVSRSFETLLLKSTFSRPIAMRRALLSFLVAALAPLQANDTFVTLGAGGLVPIRAPGIAMESEDLEISVHEISVHYVFRNQTNQDVVGTMAFPLPELDGGDVAHEPFSIPRESSLNFVDFRALSGDKAITTSIEARAFKDGRDVTPQLQALALSPLVVVDFLNRGLMKLTPSQRTKLEREELVVQEEGLLGSGKPGWWANWKLRVQFYWKQVFPANSTVELKQTYHPVVGGSYIVDSDTGESSVAPYCGGSDTIRKIAQFKRQHPAKEPSDTVLMERQIRYILTTANNWSGPIRKFRLTITSDSPDDIALNCLRGLKRLSPSKYELLKTDFRPQKELDVLILEAAEPGRQR